MSPWILMVPPPDEVRRSTAVVVESLIVAVRVRSVSPGARGDSKRIFGALTTDLPDHSQFLWMRFAERETSMVPATLLKMSLSLLRGWREPPLRLSEKGKV